MSKNQKISLKDDYLKKLMYAAILKNDIFNFYDIKKKIEFFLENEKLRKKIFDNLNKLPTKKNFRLKEKLKEFTYEINCN
jgi:hypothetical protein